MFEGDSADTCARKFPLTSMGAEQRVSRAQTRERGPHRRERKFILLFLEIMENFTYSKTEDESTNENQLYHLKLQK